MTKTVDINLLTKAGYSTPLCEVDIQFAVQVNQLKFSD